MTEDEWLASEDPGKMLKFLRRNTDLRYQRVSDNTPLGQRRLRLFGVAIMRRVADVFNDPCLHEIVEAVGGFADGIGTAVAFRNLQQQLRVRVFPLPLKEWSRIGCRELLTQHTREEFAHMVAYCLAASDHAASNAADGYHYAALAIEGEDMAYEMTYQCDLIRDIFGNPFNPITIDPSWLTSTVIALAQKMYDTREFSAMPILADALMDAGCDNPQILEHCRGPGPHVRGCWVCDLCLGKK